MGYERCGQVETGRAVLRPGRDPGSFSADGGKPGARSSCGGDEIDSIRSFDAESQRSVERLESLKVYPARELVLTKARLEHGDRGI